MTKHESAQIEYAISDLEALREFNLLHESHRPKLDRAIDRLSKLCPKVNKKLLTPPTQE